MLTLPRKVCALTGISKAYNSNIFSDPQALPFGLEAKLGAPAPQESIEAQARLPEAGKEASGDHAPDFLPWKIKK